MKIGIVTWFTGPNYGTNLQAIALQRIIRQAGHEVMLINYDEKLVYVPRTLSFKEKVINKFNVYTMKAARFIYKPLIHKRDSLLRAQIHKNCVLTRFAATEQEFVEICKEFDLLVFGSDQLWNPNWYSPIYFADYEGIDVRKISYAPSIGVNNIPKDKHRLIEHGLKGFNAVSVREKRGAQLLEDHSPVKPVNVLDPTLLMNMADWEQVFPDKQRYVKQRYVLSIMLTDNIFHFAASVLFARRKGQELVTVPYMGLSYFQPGTVLADTDLSRLLSLIKNADHIITDSFHITVFSIIFRKQFYVLKRFKEDKNTSTNCRITELLDKLGLSNRLIRHNSCKIPNMKAIDYCKVIPLLDKEINASKNYLFNSITEKGGENEI